MVDVLLAASFQALRLSRIIAEKNPVSEHF